MQFYGSTTESQLEPTIRVPLQLRKHFAASLVVVWEVQRYIRAIRVIGILGVVLRRRGHVCREESSYAYLVEELILTRTAEQSQHFQYGKHERWVAHQGRERGDEAVEISGGNVTSAGNTVRAG